MSFVQLAFAIFLPVVFGVWLAVRKRYVLAAVWLLTASLFFYGFRQPWALWIIVAYCLVDWGTGIWISRTRYRRLALATGITFNLLILCFWKYTPMLLQTFAALFGWHSLRIEQIAAGGWVVPMGISFYAFIGIAYMVDVYRRTVEPEPNPLRYMLFASFFPHLVAGPILRANEFLKDLRPETMPTKPLAPAEGTFLIARGFFKKLVLADSIAVAIDPFFAEVSNPATAGVWATPYIYLYALQIYFDFSGYTDIARGLGLWFGFRWPENFNWPYLATSIQDFWRKWHMTLSRFLRDYLYIPLGGNRGGPLHVSMALMVTMLLGGLWHGASWSFMLWGGLHGLFLIVNRLWGETALHGRLAALTGPAGTAWLWLRIALTFNAVCFAWCFFRLTQLQDSLACVAKLFVFDWNKAFAGGSADPALWTLLAGYAIATVAARIVTARAELPLAVARLETNALTAGALWGSSIGLLALALLLNPGVQVQPFIYFQF